MFSVLSAPQLLCPPRPGSRVDPRSRCPTSPLACLPCAADLSLREGTRVSAARPVTPKPPHPLLPCVGPRMSHLNQGGRATRAPQDRAVPAAKWKPALLWTTPVKRCIDGIMGGPSWTVPEATAPHAGGQHPRPAPAPLPHCCPTRRPQSRPCALLTRPVGPSHLRPAPPDPCPLGPHPNTAAPPQPKPRPWTPTL